MGGWRRCSRAAYDKFLLLVGRDNPYCLILNVSVLLNIDSAMRWQPHCTCYSSSLWVEKKFISKESCYISPDLLWFGRAHKSSPRPNQRHKFTSMIMKKSSPCSPCTTIFSWSSNCTDSRESATVNRSHSSRFSDRERKAYEKPCWNVNLLWERYGLEFPFRIALKC